MLMVGIWWGIASFFSDELEKNPDIRMGI